LERVGNGGVALPLNGLNMVPDRPVKPALSRRVELAQSSPRPRAVAGTSLRLCPILGLLVRVRAGQPAAPILLDASPHQPWLCSLFAGWTQPRDAWQLPRLLRRCGSLDEPFRRIVVPAERAACDCTAGAVEAANMWGRQLSRNVSLPKRCKFIRSEGAPDGASGIREANRISRSGAG
jgi:hypothetical protein